MKKRGKSKTKRRSDSEDLVKMTHKGLDKCASLLAHLMSDDQCDESDRCEEKEKQPLQRKTKETKIKQKKGKQSNQQKVKKKVSKEQEEKRLRVDKDKHKTVVKELSQRMSYHPELVSSTPHSKIQRAESQTGLQGVIKLHVSNQQLQFKGYCNEGSVRYPSNPGLNPGLIGGQMIPERDAANTYDQQKHSQDVEANRVLPGERLASSRAFDNDVMIFSSREGQIWPEMYNTCQKIGPDLSRNPHQYSEQDQGIAGYSLYSEGSDNLKRTVETRQSSMVPTDGVRVAKNVLRDLVDTLKTINERDAVSLDTKSKQQPELERFDHDNNRCNADWMEYSKNILAADTSGDVEGQSRENTHHKEQKMKNAKEEEEEQQETIILSDSQSKELGLQVLVPPDSRNILIRDQVSQENMAEEELKSSRKWNLYQQSEGEKGGLVTETEGRCTNDQNNREISPEIRRKSPDTKKRKKKKVPDELSGKSCKDKDKKPLLEQQRVLNYLVTELKAVTEGKGSLEVDNLFHSILDTIDNLPFLTMDSEVQTEIAMALQPLRSENATLRRKLRIVNQQMKELQRQINGIDERKLQNSETSAVKALCATLQEQLSSEEQECSVLRNLVSKLQDDLKMAEEKCEDLFKGNEHKDECHLRSQMEWMSEMAALRKQQTCSKQEVQTTRWKLETLKKENDFLQNNLTETRRNLEKADQTTQLLEDMLARLAPSKDGELTTVCMATRAQYSQKAGQSELKKKTSPKRKRDTEELRELKSSLKVKRVLPMVNRDDRERLDKSMKENCRLSFIDNTITAEVRSSDGIDRFLGGTRKYPLDEGGIHNSRSFSEENEKENRRLSLSGEERLYKDYYDKCHEKNTHDKASIVSCERLPSRATSKSVLQSQSHNAIHLCDKESSPSEQFSTVRGQVGFDVIRNYDTRRSTSNTFNPDQSAFCNAASHITHQVIPTQNPLHRLTITTDVSDQDSCASDSTSSTVTSLFEVQFQLGLSNLDQKISKLQENLQNLKKL